MPREGVATAAIPALRDANLEREINRYEKLRAGPYMRKRLSAYKRAASHVAEQCSVAVLIYGTPQ